MKVGILGSGGVAQTLAAGFIKHGHNVMVGTRDKSKTCGMEPKKLASARESLCWGLRSRWFMERFHMNALVTHVQHGQVFCAARRLENYAVARC